MTVILVASILFTLCSCVNNEDKEKLCEGVWVENFEWIFDTEYWRVYDFSTDGTFEYTVYYKGYINEITKDKYYTGTYKIDSKKHQITLSFNEDDDYLKSMQKIISYYISEYNHSMIFDTNEKGESSYRHYSSLGDVYFPYPIR